jgi:hypothetical protein
MISLQLNFRDQLDVLSLFYVENAIYCSTPLLFRVICTSLRSKHSLLILEKATSSFPQFSIDSRWSAGDDWCWLSPRSLGPITSMFNHHDPNFDDFKLFLNNKK